ncbi:MAG: UDP-N-acetylmuramoyl-tripeptide--D-alanyl-D-alanine ligase [candidate division KSB1 bacterium]|nr:UDP-N-acetylmuramoyl-tripeptide--D-alanyl-D-alanine ligase [candidate division KSB1 bacterium]
MQRINLSRGMPMHLTLDEILRATSVDHLTPTVPREPLSAVEIDSRSVSRNSLFVALRGIRHDGHDYVENALAQGAAAAVVETSWLNERRRSLPLIGVRDTLKAYQDIARFYRRKIDPAVVAITGSVGKTTAKEMIHAVLAQQFRAKKNIKSYNNHIGVPATLLQLEAEDQILVAELGTSAFGEIERLSELVEPDVCVLLNIGWAHLEFLESREGIARAKMEIFAHAAQDAVAVYNADDPLLRVQNYPALRRLTFGIEQSADVRACILECLPDGRYRFAVDEVQMVPSLPGRHTVYNALAAVAVGRIFQVPDAQIKEAIEHVVGAEHRLQVIHGRGLTIIDDAYNANPGSCAAALQTCADMAASGRRIAVLGDMLELGNYAEAEHRKLADQVVQLHLDALFLTGELTRFTYARAKELGYTSVFHFPTREELGDSLKAFLRDGDVVLIKGSRAMGMEKIIENLLAGEPPCSTIG